MAEDGGGGGGGGGKDSSAIAAAHPPLTIASSLKHIVFFSYLNILCVFIPLGFIAYFLKWGNVPVFVINFLAIIPLSKLLGMATEQVGGRNRE